jgi:CRISPR-associated protein Cas1
LDLLSKVANPLADMVKSANFDEARAAKIYFSRYFHVMGAVKQNRANRQVGWLNALLNYGYAVLSALVHRAIVVHGLIPQLGIHHKPRYGTWPLVYDLMEPFRAVVDAHVWSFCNEERCASEFSLLENFARFIGKELKDFRVTHKRYDIKLVDAIDFMVRSYATACEKRNAAEFWVPQFLPAHYEATHFDDQK